MTFSDKIKIALRLLIQAPSQFFLIQWRRFTRKTWLKKEKINGKIGAVKFTFDFKQSDILKYMYTGSYEADTYLSLKYFLKRGDTFIDVGANIGYISSLALNFVGTEGQVHAFEPIQKYFKQLERIKQENGQYHFFPNNAAISQTEGKTQIAINSSDNIGNNSMLIDSIPEKELEEITTLNLSNYLKSNGLNPSLIKIDTEGFEIEVLKSLTEHINNAEVKPVILCEVTPEVYAHINQSITDLKALIDSWDYSSFQLGQMSQAIDLNTIGERVDLIFKYQVK